MTGNKSAFYFSTSGLLLMYRKSRFLRWRILRQGISFAQRVIMGDSEWNFQTYCQPYEKKITMVVYRVCQKDWKSKHVKLLKLIDLAFQSWIKVFSICLILQEVETGFFHSSDNLSLCFLCQVDNMPPLRVSLLWKLLMSERAGILYCCSLQERCTMILLEKAAYLLASATANSVERSIHLEKALPMNVKNGKHHGCLHVFLWMIVNASAFFSLPLSHKRLPENILNLTFMLHVYTTNFMKSFVAAVAYRREVILRKWSKMQFQNTWGYLAVC